MAREDAIENRDAELTAGRGRLGTLEMKFKAERAELDAKAKVLAEDCEAFKLLEVRSRTAVQSLYEKELEEPLAASNEGPAQLLPYLVDALEDVVSGIGPMAEGEARVLSSAALTRVFSHLHLRDPAARLDELLEPVDDERCATAAEAVKGQVEALLKKFLAIDPAGMAGDKDGHDGVVVVEAAGEEAVGELGDPELRRHGRRAAAEPREPRRRLVHGREAAAHGEVAAGGAPWRHAQRVGDEEPRGGSGAVDDEVGRADVLGGGGAVGGAGPAGGGVAGAVGEVGPGVDPEAGWRRRSSWGGRRERANGDGEGAVLSQAPR